MARTTTTHEESLEEHILDVDVTEEMETSFLEYSYSVIYSRALPDARDGLKPVQRRILFSMHEMGIRPDRSHVKCARVVGQVMGLLHPHGDGAIYDAMVRMAQPWAMRLPLIDGHGNFGSLDAGPAAMRYTECRMAQPALAMTAGIDEDTVDFRPNYDGKESEPVVLPAAFPNLLVNGATGIAVGMATNIAPHNLVETVAALKQLLERPEVSVDELMRYLPGPDFAAGGKIIGLDGIRDAYHTGRGTFRIRATARIEKVSPRRMGIIVTELPPMVGPERIIEQIKHGVESKKLQGIADVKDLTDLANGLRLVIEVKNGINPDALLEQLYRATKLEDSFAINAVALVEGQPRTLNLKEMLEVYLAHRLEVTLRRSNHRLAKASDRLHLQRGLMTAILDIDDVIAIIRGSDDTGQARDRLMAAFDLDEVQSDYILDMPLRRLTKFSTLEIQKLIDELTSQIEALREIIDNPGVLRALVRRELDDMARQFGTPRRTILLASSGAPASAAATPLEVPDAPCWVMLSGTGLVARTTTGAPLPAEGPRAAHDAVVSAIRVTTKAQFGLITNRGRLVRCRAIELPTVPLTASAPSLQGGSLVSELWPLGPGERPLCLTSLDAGSLGLALGTRRGIVKRVNADIIGKDSWDVIRLDDGDEVVGAVELTRLERDLAFVTSDAHLLHFPAAGVRAQGRLGGGMAGIKLAPGAHVVWFGAAGEDDHVVSIAGSSSALPGTEPGTAKVTPLREYPAKGRATGGVRCHRFLRGEDTLISAAVRPSPVAAAASGSPVELPPATGRRDGSGVALAQPVAAIAGRPAAEPVDAE